MATKPRKVSNISFMPAVESVSRKFALRRETCSKTVNQQNQEHVNTYMGSGARTKKYNGGFVLQNYFFMRKYARQSALSADEIANRSNFTLASKWAKGAATDLMAISHNQAIFVQSNNGGKSSTVKGVWAGDYNFRGFCFAVAMAILAGGDTLPQNHELPSIDA